MNLSNYFIKYGLICLLMSCNFYNVLAGKDDLNANFAQQNQIETVVDVEQSRSMLSEDPSPISIPKLCSRMEELNQNKENTISKDKLKEYYGLTTTNAKQEAFLDSVISYFDFVVKYLGEITISTDSHEISLTIYPDAAYLPADIFSFDGLTNLYIPKGKEINFLKGSNITSFKEHSGCGESPVYELSCLFKNSNIKKIEIARDVKSIENDFFTCVPNLEQIIFHKNVRTIKKNAFFDCENLKKVEIHGEVDIIEDNAFDRCTNLEEIEIGLINKKKFETCGNSKVYWKPMEIGDPFNSCNNLKKVKIYQKIDKIPFFSSAEIEEIEIGAIDRIDFPSFADYNALKKVTIYEKTGRINKEAFFHCEELEEVNLMGGFDDIEDFAFDGCPKLKNYGWAYNFILPMRYSCDSRAKMGFNSLPNAEAIKDKYKDKKSNVSIEDLRAIYGVTAEDKNSQQWETFFERSIDYYDFLTQLLGEIRVIDEGEKKKIILEIYPEIEHMPILILSPGCMISEIYIPENSNFKNLGCDTFWNLENLKKVEIHCKLDAIEGNAFNNCPNLEEIIFSQGLQDCKISPNAFENCPKLSSGPGQSADYRYFCSIYPDRSFKLEDHLLNTQKYRTNEGFEVYIFSNNTAIISRLCEDKSNEIDDIYSQISEYTTLDIPKYVHYEKGVAEVKFISKGFIDSLPGNIVLKIYADLEKPERAFEEFRPKHILAAFLMNQNKKVYSKEYWHLGKGGYGCIDVACNNGILSVIKTMDVEDRYGAHLKFNLNDVKVELSSEIEKDMRNNESLDFFVEKYGDFILEEYSKQASVGREFLFCKFLKEKQEQGSCPECFAKIYSCDLALEKSSREDAPNIIKSAINMQLIPGVNLSMVSNFIKMTYSQKLNIISQLAEGLNYMHKNGFVHNDLRLPNVMFDPIKSNVYIIDFGLATKINEHVPDDVAMNEFAPERLTGERYSYKAQPASDVFSYGQVVYQFFTGSKRRYTVNEPETHKAELEETMTNFQTFLPDDNKKLFDIVKECCSYDSADRPTLDQVIPRLKSCQSSTTFLHPTVWEREDPAIYL